MATAQDIKQIDRLRHDAKRLGLTIGTNSSDSFSIYVRGKQGFPVGSLRLSNTEQVKVFWLYSIYAGKVGKVSMLMPGLDL